MDDLVRESSTPCFDVPEHKVLAYAHQFYNDTVFENRSIELPAYSCAYYRLMQLTHTVNYWNGQANVVACIMGYASAILALMTLTQTEYDARVSFFYLRLINAVEVICTTFNVSDAISSLLTPSLMRYKAWAYWNAYVVYKFRNGFVVWTNFIILWLTVERAAACLASDFFRLINKKHVARLASIIAATLAFAIMFPEGFYSYPVWNENSKMYDFNVTEFGQSQFYNVYVHVSVGVLVLSAVLLLGATITATYGYYKFIQKRKSSMAFASKRSPAGKISLSSPSIRRSAQHSQQAIDAQLCLLQLCEALPLVVNQLIYSVIKSISPLPFIAVRNNLYNAPLRLTFEDALRDLNRVVVLTYLRLPNNMTAVAAHCCHFYWYVAFCPKYRRSFVRLLRKFGKVGSTLKLRRHNARHEHSERML